MSPNIIRALELEMQRQAIIGMLVLAVMFAVTMWVLYHAIRAGVRDGIKEAGITQNWQRTVALTREASALPEMRADR